MQEWIGRGLDRDWTWMGRAAELGPSKALGKAKRSDERQRLPYSRSISEGLAGFVGTQRNKSDSEGGKSRYPGRTVL